MNDDDIDDALANLTGEEEELEEEDGEDVVSDMEELETECEEEVDLAENSGKENEEKSCEKKEKKTQQSLKRKREDDGHDADFSSSDEEGDIGQPKKQRVLEQQVNKRQQLRKKRSEEKRLLDQAEAQRKTEVASKAKNLLAETVLGPGDFEKMRKLQLKKSTERHMGRKMRQSDEFAFSDSEDDSDGSDSEPDSDEEAVLGKAEMKKKEMAKAQREVYNDLDFIDPNKLDGYRRKKHDKFTRMQSVKKGREGLDTHKDRRTRRAGGSTNKEKERKKPMLMTIKGRRVRCKKSGKKATNKMADARKHVGNLKKKAGKNKVRRG